MAQGDDNNYFGGVENPHNEFINEREVVLSRITEKVFDLYQTMSLHEILYTPESMHPKGEFIIDNLYKTKFFVLGLLPHNLMEIC
jgi:hypothetical protein